MRNKDVVRELAYVLAAQYCCALSLAAENQPDHFDVLTFPSGSSRKCRGCSVTTFVMLSSETSGVDGQGERHRR